MEAGGTATFTVKASGLVLTYQWFGPDGNALTDSDGEIEGSATATLRIINVESGDAGDYTVVVTNILRSVVTFGAATLSIGELEEFEQTQSYNCLYTLQLRVGDELIPEHTSKLIMQCALQCIVSLCIYT